MYYLPQNLFGKLSIDSVYHYYDVPRAFLVSSNKLKKDKYLVFWTDESESGDTWYYALVNEREISRFEAGQVQLRDVFLYKKIFEVVTPFDVDIESTVRGLAAVEVDDDALPPEGVAICLADDGWIVELP
ncbi:DUF6575 domain-containing protein [Shewanella colwelliana]|uniref:DUF6575 domain-containing protein n=1 Tax=Shewanella colwelliana TaxID=23 RepID=UPI003736B5C6